MEQIDKSKGLFKSRQKNAIVRLFRLLREKDIDLLGGVSSREIRYVLGAPRKGASGRGKREAVDLKIYNILEGLTDTEREGKPFMMWDTIDMLKIMAPPVENEDAYHGGLPRRRKLEEEFRMEVEKRFGPSAWSAWEKRERNFLLLHTPRLRRGAKELRKVCEKNFGPAWKRHARGFLLLHELKAHLEGRAIWNREDAAAFKTKRVSQIISRLLSGLEKIGMIGEYTTQAGQKRSYRLGVRYKDGPNLWREPSRWRGLKREISSTKLEDQLSKGPICLVGVSRLYPASPGRRRSRKSAHTPASFDSGFENDMVDDLNKCARELREKWLFVHRERMDQILAQNRTEFIRLLREGLASRDGLSAIADKVRAMRAKTEAIMPKLPLVLIDFNSLESE